MTRLWRAVTLVLTATALLIGPGAALAFAGESDGRGDAAGDRARNRDHAAAPVVDEVAPVDDDGEAPAPQREQTRDGERDQVRDRDQRPDCERDAETDQVRDCRPHQPEIRPNLARCIEYVQGETDRVIRRSLRWWWRVCHRLAWNHNHSD